MIKIVIADDMPDIREYLCDILQAQPDIKVVGMAGSGAEAVKLARELMPDIVLMDIQMEDKFSGIRAIEQIHGAYPQIKCLVHTIHENDEYLFKSYLAGASDYIVKSMPPEKILRSVNDVMNNELLLRPEDARKIISEYQRTSQAQNQIRETLRIMMLISPTEYEVLRLIYQGYNYRMIARMRSVEETTIRSQVNHILRKFKKRRMKEVIELLKDLQIFEGE